MASESGFSFTAESSIDSVPEEKSDKATGRYSTDSCKVCAEPRHRASGYCQVHKRAYDNIYKQCKGKGKNAEASSAWDQIFGEGGDDVIRQKVLCDYIAAHPDGKEDLRKPRGKVDLTQYIHETGARQSTDDVGFLAKLDYEAFLQRTFQSRGWDKVKANAEWELLKNNPATISDQKGPSKLPLRLYVSSTYLGEDRVENRAGVYESKAVKQATKAQRNMQSEQVQQLRGETQRGFNRDLLAGESLAALGSTFAHALPTGALTAPVGQLVSAEGLVVAAAGGQREVGGSGSRVASEAGLEEPTPKKIRTVDMLSQRNTAHSDLERELNKLVGGVSGLIQDAMITHTQGDATLDEDFMETLKQRYELLLLCLGKTAKLSKEDEQQKVALESLDVVVAATKRFTEDIDDAETLAANKHLLVKQDAEEEHVHKSRVHQKMLAQEMSRLVFMPVEDPSALRSLSHLQSLLRQLRKVTTPDALETIVTEVQQAKAALEELKKSVKQSSTDLKGNLAKRARDQQREARAKEKREREGQTKRKSEADSKDKLKTGVKIFAIMQDMLDQPVPMDRYETTKQDGSAGALDKPFVVAPCEKIKGIDGVLLKTLESWSLQFRGAAQCRSADRRTQAPLSAAAGLAAANAIIQDFMPAAAASLNKSTLAQAVSQTWLFGYMPDLEAILPEPGCLGSVRLHVGGQCSVVAARPSELCKHLIAAGACFSDKAKPSILELIAWLKAATVQQLQAVKKDCSLWAAVVQEGSALVMPPGYIVVLKPENNKQVWGLRRSFFNTSASVIEDLKCLQELHKFASLSDDSNRLQELVVIAGAKA